MVTEDARDMAAASGGDQTALARLYDRHAAVVLSLCRRAGLSAAEADDACQETFIRAFDRLDQLETPDKFRAWAYAIARNVCSERRRAAGRRHRHEEQAMKMKMQTTDDRVEPASVDQVGDREALDRLTDAMDQLPDSERLALHLYYLDADPVNAASSVLGVSRSGYYKLLTRARASLASILREVQPSAGVAQ